MYIIPAIDIIDGQCVRLEQGIYDRKKVYHHDPVEVAKMFEDHGLERLHLVDLDGAKANRVINLKVLEQIILQTNLHVDWGGGIKSRQDLDLVFGSGAQQATVGSIAAENPSLFHEWLDLFGGHRLILGADLRFEKVATRGWKELSEIHWKDFFRIHISQGVKTIISTDIAKDGMLEGPSTDLYRQMIEAFPDIQLVASGGISNITDLAELKEAGCFGAIVGKAIYEQKITLSQIQSFI